MPCSPSPQPQNITALSLHDILLSPDATISKVSLVLKHLLIMPPLGIPLANLHSADLPLHGSVFVTSNDVTSLPYVGKVDLISELDSSNAVIQQAGPVGVLVRGSVSEGRLGTQV